MLFLRRNFAIVNVAHGFSSRSIPVCDCFFVVRSILCSFLKPFFAASKGDMRSIASCRICRHTHVTGFRVSMSDINHIIFGSVLEL